MYIIIIMDLKIDEPLRAGFVTQNSKDVPIKNILYLDKVISRPNIVIDIDMSLKDFPKAILIENGIFEYSLVHAHKNNFEYSLIPAIYNDKLQDILLNLADDSYLQNRTFKLAIIDGVLDPQQVAFLSPEQMHPENWATIVNKMKLREQTENTMRTTDVYRCPKCKERKCTMTELQMRCADEPTNKIITCLVCYTTFIK
jgi:DNA-directed RNA polymerase subunit M/transcription elongation factor TFIIS